MDKTREAPSSCAPLSSSKLLNISPSGVYYSLNVHLYLLLGSIKVTREGKGYWEPVYSFSSNLVDWTALKHLLNPKDERKIGSVAYPSLIDETSADNNYSTVNGSASMYFVKSVVPPLNRRLLHLTLDLTGLHE